MGKVVHNNYITIAKAMGILLMVIGHSGCPQVLFRIIYLFHMPLFFFLSGIFAKEYTFVGLLGGVSNDIGFVSAKQI